MELTITTIKNRPFIDIGQVESKDGEWVKWVDVLAYVNGWDSEKPYPRSHEEV